MIRKVTIAYANAIAAQEAIDLAQREHDLAQDILDGVSRRVNAAAEPLHQRNKAQITLTASELALNKAKRERDAALNGLARLTGMAKPSSLQADDFYAIDAPNDLVIKIEDTPDHQRLHQEIGLRKSALDLEQANATPDPTITIGARNFREDDENALVLGVSFPLPVANLNRGNIQKAGQDIATAEAIHDRSLRDAYATLEEREYALKAAYEEAQAMKATILPQAEGALKNARRGYEAGAFAYLDVLDAQRTLADTKRAYLVALRDYHINKAEIDYLTAPATFTETNQ